MDLIDRYRKWRVTHSNESDSDSESDSDPQNNSDDSDWNMTVKGSSSTPYIEQLNDNEPTLDNLRIEVNVQQNNVNNGVSVSAFEERLSTTTTTTSSPVKETRRSPSKDQT